ncbi:hypothetical protein GQ54DRAFT_187500 [Martensiomyces pterosporus]|nr:hypothetical protein GQ54DRAFT_187500 [Martensiomyces pterosporus]
MACVASSVRTFNYSTWRSLFLSTSNHTFIHKMEAQSKGSPKGQHQAKEGAGPYILQTLALGLQLDEQSAPGAAKPAAAPRRQSLSQRLGLQSAADKGKEPDIGSDAELPQQEEPAELDQAAKSGDGPDTSTAPTQGTAGEEGKKTQEASSSPALSAAQAAKQRSVKIECAEVAGNDLYVGTNDGHLIHYTLVTPEIESTEAPDHFKVQSVDLKMGGRRVEQILAFPGMCKLVVVCGSTVMFYSLPELRPVAKSSAPSIKGVSCIAYDERIQRSTATVAILCVARMREIQIYRLGAELRLEQEISIENSVASICQYGNYVCLADTERYKILDLAKIRSSSLEEGQLELLPTQQPYRDARTGKVVRPPRPRTLVVGPNEFMFLTSSGDETTLGVIVTALGEALRGTLQFATFPKSIVYDDPYAIAVFGSGQVEVYDTRRPEQTLSQRFFDPSVDADCDQPGRRPRRLCMAAGLHLSTSISRPSVADGSSPGMRGSTDSPTLDISKLFSPTQQHQRGKSELETTPWTDALAQSPHVRREVLGDSSPAPAGGGAGKALSRFIKTSIVLVAQDSLYALATQPRLVEIDRLMDSQRVEEAVLMVEEALASDPSLNATSDEVSYCFQKAGMVCLKNMLFDDALQYFRRGYLDPRALAHLFPESVEYLGSLLVPFGQISMAAGLRSIFYDIGDMEQLIKRGAEQLSGDNDEQMALLRETLKTNALDVSERYLEHARTQMQQNDRPYAPDAIPVIDTMLARLYSVNSQHDKLCKLIQSRNSIASDLAGDYFMNTKHYYYCSLIYKAHGDAEKVLGMWRRILSGEWEDARFGGLPEYLEYLEHIQHLSDQEVLLREYYWLIDFDVGSSLQVLTYLPDKAVVTIDADRVIRKIEVYGDEALRAFIERLISSRHAKATHYMTYLVKVYVRQIRDYYLADTPEAQGHRQLLETGFRRAQAEDIGLSFRSYLKSVSNTDSGTSLRTQLLKTLASRPPSYDAEDVLGCIEKEARDYLYTERAMLLVILGQNDRAVDILVNEGGDYAEAELLLLRPKALSSLAQLRQQPRGSPQSNSSASSLQQQQRSSHAINEEVSSVHQGLGLWPENVYRLFAMYLQLDEGDDDTKARLVSGLLSKYGEYLGMGILEQIPDHWQYSVVEPFVRHGLGRLMHSKQTTSVERSLRQSLAFGSKVELIDANESKGAISLDFAQVCAKCGKLLGSSSFAYRPDSQEISHITCL